jgi:hypothetical protein
LSVLRLIEREADCKITGLAVAFGARPALTLGVFPKVAAVADEMFGVILIRLKLEGD